MQNALWGVTGDKGGGGGSGGEHEDRDVLTPAVWTRAALASTAPPLARPRRPGCQRLLPQPRLQELLPASPPLQPPQQSRAETLPAKAGRRHGCSRGQGAAPKPQPGAAEGGGCPGHSYAALLQLQQLVVGKSNVHGDHGFASGVAAAPQARSETACVCQCPSAAASDGSGLGLQRPA